MKNSKSITTQTDKMYYLFVVTPLEEIIKNLEDGEKYRMDFLDEKLASYMKTAAVSLGYCPNLVNERRETRVWNEYTKNYYLKNFKQLLQYLKNQNS